MSKVLVVDDEQIYREELELALSSHGHEVRTAGSGREAVEVGARYRPDVLVADWMLKNDIHGLHVADVLSLVKPEVQTILITGFASPDLVAGAEQADVFEFIEKPFEADRIVGAVSRASATRRKPGKSPAFGVVEVDSGGRIIYASPAARELFAVTSAGRDVGRLDELFGPDALAQLDQAGRRWVVVSPQAAELVYWRARARDWPGEGRLLVLSSREGADDGRHPVVRMLLGHEPLRLAKWPIAGRGLVVEDHGLVRRVLVEGLERSGCICHAAATHQQALQVFERDPDVQVVILDSEVSDGDSGEFVRQLRALRPDVCIVGTSPLQRRAHFAAMGVELFLWKPWTVADLVDLIAPAADGPAQTD
jgi:DNA-binding NtrC family response regulator